MPITQTQVARAQAAQNRAAHSGAGQVRLLAGPGTGKSRSIEERVRWLVDQGHNADRIAAVSFTRAAARDLEARIHSLGARLGQPALTRVHVSTLHSLALGILRRAGLLRRYPVDPLVLDDWELGNILDAEFGVENHIRSKTRRGDIRRHYEAFCSTGSWSPPGLPPAQPPVTQYERQGFQNFLPPRSQIYSCVLPGELVKQCVDEARAGAIDLVRLADLSHLIVDEYQDLNPVDLEFIDILAHGGVAIFVAGDDDQSIYAFRYAAPAGIQQFHAKYPGADMHTLQDCFRCTPVVLDTAYRVVQAFPDPNRLPKNVSSLYDNSNPPVGGVVHAWRFGGSTQEAEAIAHSCAELISVGVAPEDIKILLSNTRTLGRSLARALESVGVPHEEPRPEAFVDTEPGRYAFALLRAVGNPDDFVALRTIMGLQRGIGPATCNQVAGTIFQSHVSFGDVASGQVPAATFQGRQRAAVSGLQAMVQALNGWQLTDLFGGRSADLDVAIQACLGPQAQASWRAETVGLPPRMQLRELRAYITAADEGSKELILAQVHARLGLAPPPAGRIGRVQVMTMHGSKGLSAKVVFIPGLEEGMLPSAKSSRYPGLIAESARLLFVSITRARAACIISFAGRRGMHGGVRTQTPSRFARPIGNWTYRNGGFTVPEAQMVADMIRDL